MFSKSLTSWLDRCIAVLCLALAASMVFFGPARAHESRPLYLEITEMGPGAWRVAWKVPASIPPQNLPLIILPDGCASADEKAPDITPDAYEGMRLFKCAGGIAGNDLTIQYPASNPSVSTMIKLTTQKGEEHIALLGPQEPSWRVPNAETAGGVARQYARLGVEHIWAGLDHLLFLVCLLWIAGDFRRVAVTITGFTIAHSLTLGLAALQIVRLPVPPVEAAIALSIVFLAREIAVGRRNTLTWKHPIAVSSSFGLLHGLGFAAVLGEIGLPQTQLLTGLLFFNVGVEIGQLVFIGAVALLFWAAKLAVSRIKILEFDLITDGLLRLAAAYSVGIIASYWMIERIIGFMASV